MLFKHLEQVIADQIIDNAFADNRTLLQTVERGGIILIVNHRKGRIIRRKNLLRLAFIHHFKLLSHGSSPFCCRKDIFKCAAFVL